MRFLFIFGSILLILLGTLGAYYLIRAHYIFSKTGGIDYDGWGRQLAPVPDWLGWILGLMGIPPAWVSWKWAIFDFVIGIATLLMFYGALRFLANAIYFKNPPHV